MSINKLIIGIITASFIIYGSSVAKLEAVNARIQVAEKEIAQIKNTINYILYEDNRQDASLGTESVGGQ